MVQRPLFFLSMLRTLLFLLLPLTNIAQTAMYFGQQRLPTPTTNCISMVEEQQVQRLLTTNGAKARLAQKTTTPVLFDWPLRQRQPLDYSYYGLSFFVDHNPASGSVVDYNGGSRTYDGHTGIDISPQPYQWDMMDNSRVEAIAAAPGTIVLRQDGNYDRRCQSDPSYVANAVILQHDDGSTTRYWHLKNGSVTTKAVGQTVAQGEYLGIVGSSGISGGPHLHFEVRDAANNVIDPFAGPSNPTTATSRWQNQKPYWDSQVLRLMTHNAEPTPYPACSANPVDVTNEKRSFVSGETVYYGMYGRDWQPGQVFSFTITQPNGVVWANFSYTRPATFQTFASVYYYNVAPLPNPAQTGVWRFKVSTLGSTFETAFNVNTTAPYTSTTALCAGSSTELTAMNSGQNATYQWQRDGVSITGATGERYAATQAGAYRVIATLNGTGITSDASIISTISGLYTLKNGSWSDPAVWSCNRVPMAADPVTVNHAVTVPADYLGNAQRVNFGVGGSIVYNAGGRLRLGL